MSRIHQEPSAPLQTFLVFFYVDLEGCTLHSLGWPQTWSNPPRLQRKRRAYMCMSSHPPSRPKLPAPSKGREVSWPSVQGGEAGHCNSLSLAARSTQHTWRDAAPPHSPGACGPGALLLWSPRSLAWRRMELSRTVMEQMTGHQSRVNRVHRLPIPSHGGGEPAAAAGRCWRPWHTHEGGRHGGGKEGRRKAGEEIHHTGSIHPKETRTTTNRGCFFPSPLPHLHAHLTTKHRPISSRVGTSPVPHSSFSLFLSESMFSLLKGNSWTWW